MITGIRTARTLTLLGVLASAPMAAAQPAPAPTSERDQARQLALEGIAANNRADWPTVISRFEHAEHLFHAPIHLRYLAIAYERTGRLRESAEMWRRLSHETLAPDAPEPFRQAVAEANREYPRLRSRLGELTIGVSNAPPDARIDLDGQPVAATDLASPILVDPGPHHVTAHASGQPDIDRAITVAVGATDEVQLPFAAPHADDAVPLPPLPPRTTTVYRSNPWRTRGIVIASVGAAIAIGGVVTGLLANSNYSTLQSNCPNFQCTTADQLAQRDTVNTLATTTDVLLIGGAVVAVAGVIIALVSGPTAETVQVGANGHGFDLAVHF